MKIDNSIHTIPNVSPGDSKKPVEITPTVPQENQGSTVHISPLAANLQSASVAEVSSVVDMERVQQVKQAISDGTFKVNSEVVADRLLETAKALISTKEG